MYVHSHTLFMRPRLLQWFEYERMNRQAHDQYNRRGRRR